MNIQINHFRHPHSPGRRRGSVMALMGLLLPIMALLAAFCINTAQMQLTRTELVVATDASAKAAGRAFSELQTVEAAKTAGRVTAALNTVDGDPLQIRELDSANEIEFGFTTQPNGWSGRYHFHKIPTSQVADGTIVASAIRVNGLRNSEGLSGRVPLIIPGILAQDDFATSQSSIAMQVDRDISLVLDRSGSMQNIDWNWPSGTSPWYGSTKDAGVAAGKLVMYRGRYYYASGQNSTTYQQWAWQEHYGLGPAPQSPWTYLLQAVDAFIEVLDVTAQEEQISVASYASDGRLDTYLEKNHAHVSNVVHAMSPGGNTAIGRGMEEGIQALLAAAARPFAEKTMVVMTDGMHNSGIDPVTVAQDLMNNYPLSIHTVTLGGGADQNRMREVAAIGGGRHYHADQGNELVAIFEEIANNLPTILTK
jgi:hypothetical protein